MNNKGIWIGAGIFLLVIAVMCVCIILYTPGEDSFYSAFNFGFGGNAVLRNTTELQVKEDTELDIECRSENIYFYESNNDTVVIKEYYRTANENFYATIVQTGNKIVISTPPRNIISIGIWFGESNKIEVYLPKEHINAISASVSSGNIRSDYNFTGDFLTASANSGNVTWNRIEAKEIELKVSSGNIKARDLTGNISLRANSGNITVEQAAGFVTASASSGNIKVLGLSGGADVKVSSGNADIDLVKLNGDISAHTSSGNVKIIVPRDSQFTVQADTTSGTIKTSFEEYMTFNKKGNSGQGTIGSNPQYRITAKASSGNVRVMY